LRNALAAFLYPNLTFLQPYNLTERQILKLAYGLHQFRAGVYLGNDHRSIHLNDLIGIAFRTANIRIIPQIWKKIALFDVFFLNNLDFCGQNRIFANE
jgi:hypothetical protein